MAQPGVFVIETDWWGDFNRSSTVKPILDLLRQGMNHPVEYVHRDVATLEELMHYLRRWRRSRRFPVLFFACHGAPGRVFLGHRQTKREAVTLDDLGEMIGPGCSGRIVHFGSCSTLSVDRRHITRFLRSTGMIAETGYRRELDWIKSSAFEVMLLATLLRYRLTLDGARRMERALRRVSPQLGRELAFRMVLREP